MVFRLHKNQENHEKRKKNHHFSLHTPPRSFSLRSCTLPPENYLKGLRSKERTGESCIVVQLPGWNGGFSLVFHGFPGFCEVEKPWKIMFFHVFKGPVSAWWVPSGPGDHSGHGGTLYDGIWLHFWWFFDDRSLEVWLFYGLGSLKTAIKWRPPALKSGGRLVPT